MKIKEIIIVFLMGLLGISMTSCSEKIDIELDAKTLNILIVDGWVTDKDSVQFVKLSLTAPYGSEKCPPATGAVVSISVDNQTYHLPEVEPGLYQTTEFRGEIGKTYNLNIRYDNEIYQAQSTMLSGFEIDSVMVQKFVGGMPADLPHYEIFISGQDDPTPDQNFVFQFAMNDKWDGNFVNWGYYTDFITNGAYLDKQRVTLVSTYDLEFDFQVRALSVSIDYMWFMDKCIFNVMPNMFFSPPPANVKGNISNNAFGYFNASSVNYSEKIRIKKEDYF
jgi:hypothetical protein